MIRCTATSKATGNRCQRLATNGMTVCCVHGGATPQAKAAAEIRIQQAEAEQAVATFGLPREVEPAVALLEEVWRSAGHVAWLAQKIAAGDESELTYRKVGKGTFEIAPSVWLDLYDRNRAHLARVCKAAIDAGLAERQVRLAEEQGQFLARFLTAVLRDLDLEDDPRAAEVVARHLRAVEAA